MVSIQAFRCVCLIGRQLDVRGVGVVCQKKKITNINKARIMPYRRFPKDPSGVQLVYVLSKWTDLMGQGSHAPKGTRRA